MSVTAETLLSSLSRLPLADWRSELMQFRSSDDLRAYLAALLSDSNALDEMARASFYHPTGGFKLVLASHGYDGPELRLHIWPQGAKVERDHNMYSVHNHKWSFASLVLHGTMAEQIFSESFDATEWLYDRYRFGSRVRGGEYESVLVGPRYLKELFCTTIPAGTAYTQASETLHNFQPAGETLAMTLFARTAYAASHTDVFVPSGAHVVLDGNGPERILRATAGELLELARDSL